MTYFDNYLLILAVFFGTTTAYAICALFAADLAYNKLSKKNEDDRATLLRLRAQLTEAQVNAARLSGYRGSL